MSGAGLGSKEMHRVLVDGRQLLLLRLMLNDLRTKLAYVTFYHQSLRCTYVGPTGIWN